MRERDAGQQLSAAELHSQRKFDLLFPNFVIHLHLSIMCGILFISEVLEITVDHDILKATEDDKTILHPDDFQHPLRCRGPDNQSTHTVRHPHSTQFTPQITTSTPPISSSSPSALLTVPPHRHIHLHLLRQPPSIQRLLQTFSKSPHRYSHWQHPSLQWPNILRTRHPSSFQ